jgi:hypothetical protein
MNEEQERFEEKLSKEGDFKLIVDFNDLNLSFSSKQMDFGDIKYKKKKIYKKETVDLKKKDSSNLF